MRVKHAVVLLMLISPLSWAGNMTFQFRNPNFGGNPNNGAFLLNSAQPRTHIKIQAMTITVLKPRQLWITLLRRFSHKFSVAYSPTLIPVNQKNGDQ